MNKFGAEFEIAGIKWTTNNMIIGNVIFNIGKDVSISPSGIEIKTPVMVDSQLPTIKELFQWAKQNGGFTNSTTGLHIHLDRPPGFDQDVFDMKYRANHDLIMKSFRPRRKRTVYCPLKQTIDTPEHCNAIYAHEQGTIEFRFFNGCLHFRYFCRCLKFARNMLYS